MHDGADGGSGEQGLHAKQSGHDAGGEFSCRVHGGLAFKRLGRQFHVERQRRLT